MKRIPPAVIASILIAGIIVFLPPVQPEVEAPYPDATGVRGVPSGAEPVAGPPAGAAPVPDQRPATARDRHSAILGPQSAVTRGESILDLAVSFEVVNRNTSRYPCPADGETYTVRGHLTGPRSGFREFGTVIVHLTGFDEGEWTFRFRDVPGYDHAREMARLGHVSLTIDQLGYGRSDHPPGHLVCWGSQADVHHQIVNDLRGGSYTVSDDRTEPAAFGTVLLFARDSAPLMAIEQIYAWDDADGLITAIFAHQGFQPYIVEIFARRSATCSAGGQSHDAPRDDPDDPTDDGPRGGGYTLFGPPDDEFRSDLFYESRADPAVIDAVIARRYRNPCGIIQSTTGAIRHNLVAMREIDIPVLLVFPGPDDPVFTRQGQEDEAANYSATDDVTSVWLDSGHFMELEECAPAFHALTARWIRERFDVGRAVPAPAVGADECVTEIRVKGR